MDIKQLPLMPQGEWERRLNEISAGTWAAYFADEHVISGKEMTIYLRGQFATAVVTIRMLIDE